MMPFVFFTIFLSVMGALNLYIYHRLFRMLAFNVSFFAAAALWTLFVMQIFFVLEARTHLFMESPALFYLLSSSVGITVILFFSALLYDLIHTAARRIPFEESRRRFIKIVFDSTMLILAASYLLRGIAGGIKRPVLNRVAVGIRGFSSEGLVIAQLSDMHIGRIIGKKFVRECVERVNGQEPDLVVITGDLVDMKLEMLADALEPLKELKSRFGTYFVLGNHEYFHGANEIVGHLTGLGITPLLNESRVIAADGQAFNLVGINDLASKRFDHLPYDVEAAFKEVDPQLPTIVLAHQPKTALIMQDKAYDLMLSGHTHGGQIFPFGFLVMIDQPYLAGLYDIDAKKQIFVSRGTGFWGPPVRVLAPSEISVLTLRPA